MSPLHLIFRLRQREHYEYLVSDIANGRFLRYLQQQQCDDGFDYCLADLALALQAKGDLADRAVRFE